MKFALGNLGIPCRLDKLQSITKINHQRQVGLSTIVKKIAIRNFLTPYQSLMQGIYPIPIHFLIKGKGVRIAAGTATLRNRESAPTRNWEGGEVSGNFVFSSISHPLHFCNYFYYKIPVAIPTSKYTKNPKLQQPKPISRPTEER